MKKLIAILFVFAVSGCAEYLGGMADEMTPDEMGAAVAACKRNGLGAAESYGMKEYRTVVVAVRCQVPRAAR